MADTRARAFEVALFGPAGAAVAEIGDADVLVGRDASCALRVEDSSVSRLHAALVLRDGRVRLRDLGSANGTFVRETPGGPGQATARMRPVREETTVAVGAVLQFGGVLGVVRHARHGDEATRVVVSDPAMQALHARALLAAASPISVLLLGETGVGKEVFARAIHDASPRRGHAFLALNCAALPPTLVESELFGHEKGAFTGATNTKQGLLESARGGTVFLDEIGELPIAIQAKLLRVLEERTVLPIGARAPRPIDVRILSATHEDLEAACTAGRFRRDLFFRLDGMTLTIPPLRDRPAEILELARVFLGRAAEGAGRGAAPAISPPAVDALLRHPWPGNVRELKNAMELAAVLAAGADVDLEHLPDRVRAAPPKASAPEGSEAERAGILDALARCDGNQTRAAELLGISRRTLVSRLIEYGMTKPRRARD